MKEVFNEDRLREEIVEQWGPHGAHVEVFDKIVDDLEKSSILLEACKKVNNESPVLEKQNLNDFHNEVSALKNKSILQEAQEAVYGDRQESYGSVTENFGTTAKLWSVILGVDVSAHQVGLMMIQLKVSREMFRPKRDNLIDIAGYACTLERLSKGE